MAYHYIKFNKQLGFDRKLRENIVKSMLMTASFITILTTFGILFSILFEAIKFFKMQSLFYFIFGVNWFPEANKFEALPLFTGTFYITAIAMLIALPIGLLSAIYMSEYATKRVRKTLKLMLEILAGIPTVVYGFFAAITIATAIVEFF